MPRLILRLCCRPAVLAFSFTEFVIAKFTLSPEIVLFFANYVLYMSRPCPVAKQMLQFTAFHFRLKLLCFLFTAWFLILCGVLLLL